MTPRQKAELRAGTIRGRLAEIAGAEELTDELRSEMSALRTEYADVEQRIAAFAIADDTPRTEPNTGDAEDRELRELRGKVELRHYMEAAIEKRGVDGAALEFNQHMNIGAHKFPLELLAPPPVEERATTDVDAGPVRPVRWLDRLFANTAASAAGVTPESVAPGMPSYQMTTGGASAAQRAREEPTADAAWTISTLELKPTRNSVRATFTREDDLRNPGLQDAITRDLRMALSEGIDRAVFLGDTGASGSDADITGLATAAIGEVAIKQDDKIKPAETLAAFTGLVDGIHASGLGDLRVVAAIGAWRLWATTIANMAAENQTLAGFLRAAGLSWTSRGMIENATTAGKIGAFVGLGRGIEGAAVAPVWSEGQMIVDPYTGAAKAETALTIHTFWNFAIVRASNFKRLKFAA